jgi:NAD(P)H-dependent FMN reductase
MSTITVISGTNRPNSNTEVIARFCEKLLQNEGLNVKFLSLQELPQSIAFTEMYGKRTPEFDAMINEYIENTNKFLIVSPEYNGSFPGLLKTLIDAVHPKFWNHKKAGLIGVADGRAGNLRGIDQLTLILNYLKINVHHNKLPISQVTKLIDENRNLHDELTQNVLAAYVKGLMEF